MAQALGAEMWSKDLSEFASWLLSLLLIPLILILSSSHGSVHDELPQCTLQGVYRQRQSLIESPNYPDTYPFNSCVDYVIRSPYRCPTKFHVQFLDFQLELSANCSRDYLAVGLQHDDRDLDVLCGQVLGIKKYQTPDGILRLRFLSDNSPWTTGGGYRLLVTRLACEREDLTARGLPATNQPDDADEPDDADDTVQVNAQLPHKQQHYHHQLQGAGHNISSPQSVLPGWPGAYPDYPAFGPGGFYLPAPCPTNEPQQQQQLQLQQQQQQQLQQLQQQLQQQQQFGQQQQLLPQQQQLLQLQQQLLQQQQLGQQQQLLPQQQQLIQQLLQQQQFGQQQQLQPQQQQLLQQQQFGQQQQLQPQQQQLLQQQQLGQQQQLLPQQQQLQPQQQQLPAISDQYQTSAFHEPAANLRDYDPQFGGQVDLCCVSSFSQAHFYLSSPGFPRTVLNALLPNQQRDCVIYLEKSSANVAGLRIQFKFFDFGQSTAAGNYPAASSAGGCSGDFIELDGQRYCGCRSGHVHKSFWPQGRKALRLRMGQSGGAASNGFLLEIFHDQDTSNYRLDGNRPLNGQSATSLPGLGGLQPQLGGFQSQLGGLQSQLGGLQAQLGGLQPQLGGLQPQLGGLQSQLGGFQSQLGYQPQAMLWPGYPGRLPSYPLSPLLPITPYRQSRQAPGSWAYARGLDAQQPARVVETNSTSKEFYYFDADQAFARAALDEDGDNEDELKATTTAPVRPGTKAFEQSSCTFDYMEVLRLSVDTLWLTKPICLAPLRSWFSNIFG